MTMRGARTHSTPPSGSGGPPSAPTLRRLVVFRFDRDPVVCRSHVRLLRRLNPDVPICGLFGGDRTGRGRAIKVAGRRLLGLDDLYCSPHIGRWSWKNGDLALAAWHRDVGHELVFDVVHLVEWDLLVVDALERVYAGVPGDAVGLTALTPVAEVADSWEWLASAECRRQWHELRAYALRTLGYAGPGIACLGVGPCFPRSFLERYAELDVPELCNDELRLPLLAHALGFRVVDTGIRRWHDEAADPFISVGKAVVAPEVIARELRRVSGRRVFHPVRTVYRGGNGGPAS